MPVAYSIDAQHHLVLTCATGILTDEDILDLKRRMAADPGFVAGMRELSDVRGVTELRVTTDGVRAMAARDAAGTPAHGGGGYRLAIVAAADEAFGMARMYQMLTEGANPNVRVFRTMDDARRWLDLA